MIDITGKKYGRITALRIDGRNKAGEIMWRCACDCGAETTIASRSLRSGNTTSCGCYKRMMAKKRLEKHGMSHTHIYQVWCSMKGRCLRSSSKDYPYYGGRGITVCDEWKCFDAFYEWAMEAGYKDGLSIERVNVNDGYHPANCTWIRVEKQSENRRNTLKAEYNGEIKRVKEWSRLLGLNYNTVRAYIRQGKNMESIVDSLSRKVEARQ